MFNGSRQTNKLLVVRIFKGPCEDLENESKLLQDLKQQDFPTESCIFPSLCSRLHTDFILSWRAEVIFSSAKRPVELLPFCI
jgi:hypothetical protein